MRQGEWQQEATQQSLGNKSQPSEDENFKELTLAQAGCLTLSWWEPRDKSPIGILLFVSTAVLLQALWEHGLLSRKWLGKVEISHPPPLFIYKSRAVNQLEPLWCFMMVFQLFCIKGRTITKGSITEIGLHSLPKVHHGWGSVDKGVCPKHRLPGHPE